MNSDVFRSRCSIASAPILRLPLVSFYCFIQMYYLCSMVSHSGACKAVMTVLMNRLDIPDDDARARSLSGTCTHGNETLARKMWGRLTR